jgi:hypothetical protein
MAVTLISHTEVGSGGTSRIEFQSIPATYDDLWLLLSFRCSNATAERDVLITYNNDTATNYSKVQVRGSGGGTDSSRTISTSGSRFEAVSASLNTANTFSSISMYIPNYKNTSYFKQTIIEHVKETSAITGEYMYLQANLWRSTSAISEIDFFPSGGNFVEYSTATLYGITKA